MLLDRNGKLVKSLDFRGTKIEFLDKLTAKELFQINASAQQAVNFMFRFKATDLAPQEWKGSVYQPIMEACGGDRAMALRLFGVVIKQALIMTPLLYRQETENANWEAVTYVRESLKF